MTISACRNLAILPSEIISTLRDWERRTGAAIYIMCAWKKPTGGAVLFE